MLRCSVRAGSDCGWCPTASRCQLKSDECDKGWSNTTCYAVCPTDKTPLHDTAGVVQLGAQSPHAVPYLPGESCIFTIWPLLDASGSRRSTLIRLQFEYVDLGQGDRIDIFSNTVEGPKLVSVSGTGDNVVNRIITSRSTAVVVKFESEGASKGGSGFRLYYRVIQGSPLDIYLISAIIVTSILTCVLCSCCCNNCIAVIADHSARLTGAAQTRALSPEEKARLPTSLYSSTQKHTYDSKECCICLSDFELGELVRELPCEHIFHPTCIDTWLEFNSLCPLCKQDVRETRHDGTGGGMTAGRTRLARLRRPGLLTNMLAWMRGPDPRTQQQQQPQPQQQHQHPPAASPPTPAAAGATAQQAAGAWGEAPDPVGTTQREAVRANSSSGSSTGVAGLGDIEMGWLIAAAVAAAAAQGEEMKDERTPG